jgi:hypothetical protein
MSRDQALKVVHARDGAYPASYLGKPLAEILAEIGLNQLEFDAICDRFTNKSIFFQDAKGNLIRRTDGSPIRKIAGV